MLSTLFRLSVFLFAIASQSLFALQFHNSVETLGKMTEIIAKKEKGAYFRFGDGDLVLSLGEKDAYQNPNPNLQKEMKEAFSLNGPNILKCLPLHCEEFGGLEPGMGPGIHMRPYEDCRFLLILAEPIWNADVEDVYSMSALAHVATNNLPLCLSFLKFLKTSGCTVLVGNEEIPLSIRTLLFGPECQFVPTPSRNSYNEIDRIEKECLEKLAYVNGYKIIVTSMGCSGRILQKRLWNQLDHVFLFDFGSLMDAICGWDTRDWIRLAHFDSQRFVNVLKKELGN